MGKIGKQRCSLKWPCDTSDATWKEVTPTSSLHLVMGLKICNDARLITSVCLRNKFTFSRKQSTTSRHLDFLYIRNDLFSICSIRWPWNGAKNKWAIVPNWIQWWLTNWCHRNTLMADTQRSHYRSNVYVIISDSGPYTHAHSLWLDVTTACTHNYCKSKAKYTKNQSLSSSSQKWFNLDCLLSEIPIFNFWNLYFLTPLKYRSQVVMSKTEFKHL